MEFLKEILGEELYTTVAEKINAYNGNEANKDKQVKIGNLGSGEYVGKNKYEALNELFKGKETELATANGLIEQLKKDTKGDKELQGKITEYESTVADLQKQLQETKIKSAVKVALLSENVVDVDYLTYQLEKNMQDKGEALELDQNDNIKDWADKLSGLKTQFPNMFQSAEAGKDGYKIYGDNKLPEGERGGSLSRADILKMSYAERNRIYNENPEGYKAAMKS